LSQHWGQTSEALKRARLNEYCQLELFPINLIYFLDFRYSPCSLLPLQVCASVGIDTRSLIAVLPYRRASGLVSLAILLTSLTACANAPTSKNLEQAFTADPRLKDNSVTVGPASNNTQPNNVTAQLPEDFPTEIPIYPNAHLQQVTQQTTQTSGKSAAPSISSDGKLTHWVSSDPSNFIESFYQKQFQTNNWQILSQPTPTQESTIEARRNNLLVTVSIQPQPFTGVNSNATSSHSQPTTGQNPAATEFVIQYVRNTSETAPATTTTPQPSAANSPGSSAGATQSAQTPIPKTATTGSGDAGFTDLNQVPQEYSQYVKDLIELGALPLDTGYKSNKSPTGTQFEPNKIIGRREYARWLFTANNDIHATIPVQQIHLASQTARPAFQDVPPTDPDFPLIQGLAEAGLIPSPLSGDDTAVLFRPDAPLTREQMILQKVPLDIHHALPNASVDTIKQTWGFQDAARIDPLALRAVLADFQNGDQSNIRRVFGYTTLFQPQKPVTRSEAAAALWYFGTQGEGLSAKDVLRIKNQQSQPAATSTPAPSSSASR